MGEVVRRDTPRENVAASQADIPPSADRSQDLLGETGSPQGAGNPSWNRSAAVLGRGVGTAVSEARRLPRQISSLRSRLQVVGKQETAAFSEKPTEGQLIERDLAAQADKAAVYSAELGRRVSDRFEDIQREGRLRLQALRQLARRAAANARQWQPEHPLQAILICAGVAFALGVMLRVGRSER